MEFPNLVYKCPGVHKRPGGTFNYLSVKDDDELRTAFEAGWSKTLPDAINGEGVTAPHIPAAVDLMAEESGDTKPQPKEDTPPTRQEILKKCDELGIRYKKTTPSKKLLESIRQKVG